MAPFALLFFVQRWKEADHRAARPLGARWPWLLVAAGALLLVPLRIVQGVDLTWGGPQWLHAAVTLTLTHVVVALLSGWKVSRSVLPATLFALLAVPLPGVVEQALVQSLTGQVVNLASSVLPYAGYPVEVAGNSFVANGEFLDVAEGCSGIRSFQGSIMAGFCLGELLRLPAVKRLLLVIGALGLAVLCNAGRIAALTRIAYGEGREAMDAAHDAVGYWALIVTYAGVALAAWLLARSVRHGNKVTRTIAPASG